MSYGSLYPYIIGIVAFSGLIYVLGKLFHSREKGVETSLDEFIASEIARYLASLSTMDEALLTNQILTRIPSSAVCELYRRSIADVKVVFQRTEADYRVGVVITPTSGGSFKAGKRLGLDDLPQEVRAAFLKSGSKEHAVDWYPTFLSKN